jgi:hypothetical protein
MVWFEKEKIEKRQHVVHYLKGAISESASKQTYSTEIDQHTELEVHNSTKRYQTNDVKDHIKQHSLTKLYDSCKPLASHREDSSFW